MNHLLDLLGPIVAVAIGIGAPYLLVRAHSRPTAIKRDDWRDEWEESPDGR